MKKLLLLFLMLFSVFTQAHGHWPQEIGAKYVLTPLYELEFSLSNYFAKRTCFDIEVNGKIVPERKTCLSSKKSKKIKIWLTSGTNQKMTNVVCSIALNDKSINTRMCTKATTMFPQSELSKEKS